MKRNKFAAFVLIFFCSGIVSAQELGLVLSGGGGKGAYEVGVWKALTEYGLAQKITEISGTSVGGLNAALFACMSEKDIERIWRTMVPEQLTDSKGSLAERFISQKGLRQIIEKVALEKIRNSASPRVTVTALRKKNTIVKMLLKKKPTTEAVRFILNVESSISEIQNELLATAAFPMVCQPVKLKDGYEYTDGGEESAGGDNTPVEPVTQNPNVHTIFIVYLNDESRLTRRVRQIDIPSAKLIEIIPSIDLGSLMEGTVNFTTERIDQLIEQGYEDAVDILNKRGYLPVSSYWFDVTPDPVEVPQETLK